MSITVPNRVVVFDYGEVISLSPSDQDRTDLLTLAGFPGTESEDSDAFWNAYWRLRPPLDQGRMLPHEYWSQIAIELGTEWSPARIHELWVADFRGWVSAEPGTIALLDELHAGGTRLAILSNAGFDFVGPFHYSPMGRYFERIFVSAELDLLKPEEPIYRHVAQELGISLDEMVFVDNKAENVETAVRLGVTGHVFVGVAELRRFLEDLSPLT